MSQYPFMPASPPFEVEPCVICGVRIALHVKERQICGICESFIPAHIPIEQAVLYLNAYIRKEYKRVLVYNDGVLSKSDTQFLYSLIDTITYI